MFLSIGNHKGISPHGYHVFRGLILATACFLLSHGEENLVRGEFGEMTECTEEGLFGNELDCSAFYQCTVDGQHHGSSEPRFKKYDFQCPPGTVFDTKIKNCNHPSDSTPVPHCDGNGTEITSTTTKRPRPQAQRRKDLIFKSQVTKGCLIDAKIEFNRRNLLTASKDCDINSQHKNELWIPLNWHFTRGANFGGKFKNKKTGKCWFVERKYALVTLEDCDTNKEGQIEFIFFGDVNQPDGKPQMRGGNIFNGSFECCFSVDEDGIRVRCTPCAGRVKYQLWDETLYTRE